MSRLKIARCEMLMRDNIKNVDVILNDIMDDVNNKKVIYKHACKAEDTVVQLENERNSTLKGKHCRSNEICADVSVRKSGKAKENILQNTDGQTDKLLCIKDTGVVQKTEDSNTTRRNNFNINLNNAHFANGSPYLKTEHSCESNNGELVLDTNKLITKKNFIGYNLLDYENKSFVNDACILTLQYNINEIPPVLNFDNANPRDEKLKTTNIDQVERVTGYRNNNGHSLESDNEIPVSDDNDVIADAVIYTVPVPKHKQLVYRDNENWCDERVANEMCESTNQPDLYSLTQNNTLSDWPDVDQLARPEMECIKHDIEYNHVSSNINDPNQSCIASLSDVIIDKSECSQQGPKIARENIDQSPALYSKINKSGKSAFVSATGGGVSSTRPLKSILLNNDGVSPRYSSPRSCHCSKMKFCSGIHKCKAVQFSEDTVFNENKTNKYRQERMGGINIRELRQGRIQNDLTLIHDGPLCTEKENKLDSLTEDTKYAITKIFNSSKEDDEASSYMERYLILKAHGLKMSDAEIVEKLPEIMKRPAYVQLIERTLVKERRKCFVRWSLAILTVVIITVTATILGIYLNHDL